MDIVELSNASREVFIDYIEKLIGEIRTARPEGWKYKLNMLQFILNDIKGK